MSHPRRPARDRCHEADASPPSPRPTPSARSGPGRRGPVWTARRPRGCILAHRAQPDVSTGRRTLAVESATRETWTGKDIAGAAGGGYEEEGSRAMTQTTTDTDVLRSL